MNTLLLGRLPREIKGVAISPDFRNMIRVEMLLTDNKLPLETRLYMALNQLYPKIPGNAQEAIEGLFWFYSRGESKKNPEGQERGRRAYDFSQDAGLIYSAFFASYGINLPDVDFMHWWEFLALFEGLPEETLIKRVMYWRTCDMTKLKGAELKHVREMRSRFALRTDGDIQKKSIEEIERETIEHYKHRIELAKKKQAEKSRTNQ